MALNNLTVRQSHIALISILTAIMKTDVEPLRQVLAGQLNDILTLVGQEVSPAVAETGHKRLKHTLKIRNQKQ